jgi:hypothetical protein
VSRLAGVPLSPEFGGEGTFLVRSNVGEIGEFGARASGRLAAQPPRGDSKPGKNYDHPDNSSDDAGRASF